MDLDGQSAEETSKLRSLSILDSRALVLDEAKTLDHLGHAA